MIFGCSNLIIGAGMKKRFIVITLMCCCSFAVLARTFAGGGEKIMQNVGSEAIWNPSSEEMEKIREGCAKSAGPALDECFVKSMENSGASPEAIAFIKLTANTAYLKDLVEAGRVSIAQVEYPFRANENEGIFLVNGFPRVIDVDNLSVLPKSELQKNPLYVHLAKDFPEISLWPDDRSQASQVIVEAIPGGGQRFIVNYQLLNGCRACEVIGSAKFAFVFDALGNFTGIKLKGIESKVGQNSGANSESARSKVEKIVVNLGQEFTITLNSNPTTGYHWQMDKSPDKSMVDLISSVFVGPETKLVGAGGREIWTFKAVGKGHTELKMKYIRPWEKDVAPVEIAEFDIFVQ